MFEHFNFLSTNGDRLVTSPTDMIVRERIYSPCSSTTTVVYWRLPFLSKGPWTTINCFSCYIGFDLESVSEMRGV